MVVVQAMLDIAPEHTSDLLERCRRIRDESLRQEADCRRFELYVDKDDPNRLHINEVYTSEAALAAHREQPYFAQFSEVPETWYTAHVYLAEVVQ